MLIEILDKESQKGDELLASLEEAGEEAGTTSINMHELLYGLKKYSRSDAKLSQLRVAPYTKEDAELSSRLELAAEKRGTAVRRLDSMIAAIAVNRSAKLSTFDLRHFEQFAKDGLKLFRPGDVSGAHLQGRDAGREKQNDRPS
ncbi:MAG: type II toxin-antitoxin system VapC family toxin [Nitrososphaerota archaeon]|nr:type II toxin-antitoxin system VapC family toxin [Nitrososphaerota archaeon]